MKILVVDKDPQVFEAAKKLPKEKFKAITVSSIVAAKAVLKELKPQVVLLNEELQGAEDFLSLIKKKKVKVILIRKDLKKPFSAEDLKSAIETAFRSKSENEGGKPTSQNIESEKEPIRTYKSQREGALRKFFRQRSVKLAFIAAIFAGAAIYLILDNLFGQVNVVVATRRLEPGAVIKSEWVALKPVPKSALIKGAYLTLQDVVGKTLKVERFPLDQIGKGMLGEKRDYFMDEVPPGQVLLTLNIPRSEAFEKVLKKGDTISVIPAEISALSPDEEPVSGIKVLEVKSFEHSEPVAPSPKEVVAYVVVSLTDAQRIAKITATEKFEIVIEGK
jgi:flagella basal body P-ring formation protein FlgA